MNPRAPNTKPNTKRAAQPRKNRTGKRTPFRAADRPPGMQAGNSISPSQVADMRRIGVETKTGQFAEQLQAGAKEVKRERLHKVLAQSGHGSRRDMEIMIASGRVMVNGLVATAGAHVGPGDVVLVDHRHVKISLSPEAPRVLLYHKPEGEIVTTSDPGNRITVFDNLPKVQNGKWVAIGRLDINTSGLLIFTTSGELANRMMHPRYEVDREYAVRVLGQLTPEQTQRLLDGIDIEEEDAGNHPDYDAHEEELEEDDDIANVFPDDDEAAEHGAEAPHQPARNPETGNILARFVSVEPKGGEGANHWYHVVIKEGRNREVRRMFESLGLTVSRLMRVRFGKIELPPRLLRGKMIELDAAQVKEILRWADMSIEGMVFPKPAQKNPNDRDVSRDGSRDLMRGNVRDDQQRRPGPGAPAHGRQGEARRGGQAGAPRDGQRAPRNHHDARGEGRRARPAGMPGEAHEGIDGNRDGPPRRNGPAGERDGNRHRGAADGQPRQGQRNKPRGHQGAGQPQGERDGNRATGGGHEARGEANGNAAAPGNGNGANFARPPGAPHSRGPKPGRQRPPQPRHEPHREPREAQAAEGSADNAGNRGPLQLPAQPAGSEKAPGARRHRARRPRGPRPPHA